MQSKLTHREAIARRRSRRFWLSAGITLIGVSTGLSQQVPSTRAATVVPENTEAPMTATTSSSALATAKTATLPATTSGLSSTLTPGATQQATNPETQTVATGVTNDGGSVATDSGAQQALLTVDTTGTVDYTTATPITDNPKADLPQPGEKLPEKYAFIPKFNGSGSTQVSVIGPNRPTTKPKTISADLTTATKGQVGFKYTNVGYDAAGNSLDLQILFMDWGRLSTDIAAYVEAYNDKIYTNFPGAGWVDVKYAFLRSDSGQPATVSGIMTLTDIDGSQTVTLTPEQWRQIDKVYIPTSTDPTTGQVDNWLRYQESDQGLTLVAPNSQSQATDQYAMLTFAYSDQSSLTFRYTDGRNEPATKSVWGVNYIPQKPLPTEVVTPRETVSDSDQTAVTTNTLQIGETNYTYTYHQTIPDEWALFYYHDVTIGGQLPTGLSLTGFQVLDETGQDVTSRFVNQSTATQLILKADPAALATADFYGHYYTVTLKAQVTNQPGQSIPLTLSTTIDGETKQANALLTVEQSPVTTPTKRPIMITVNDVDGLNQLLGTRQITAVAGETYTVTPLTGLANGYVYSFSDKPLSGTSDHDFTINLVYGLSYTDYQHYPDKSMKMTVYNGNGKVVEQDWTFDDGTGVAVKRDLQTGKLTTTVFNPKTGVFTSVKDNATGTNDGSMTVDLDSSGSQVTLTLNSQTGQAELVSHKQVVISNQGLKDTIYFNANGVVFQETKQFPNGVTVSTQRLRGQNKYRVTYTNGSNSQTMIMSADSYHDFKVNNMSYDQLFLNEAGEIESVSRLTMELPVDMGPARVPNGQSPTMDLPTKFASKRQSLPQTSESTAANPSLIVTAGAAIVSGLLVLVGARRRRE